MISNFSLIAESREPGPEQIRFFIYGISEFFEAVLFKYSEDFDFLWGRDRELKGLAEETYQEDVRRGMEDVATRAFDIDPEQVESHGLSGLPLRFKFKVLDSINRQFERLKRDWVDGGMRKWFSAMVDAIDAILDSIIDAMNGVGGLVKEFKDALKSLATMNA